MAYFMNYTNYFCTAKTAFDERNKDFVGFSDVMVCVWITS